VWSWVLFNSRFCEKPEELFGLEYFNTGASRLGLDLLELDYVLHKVTEAYLFTTQVVDHSIN